MSYTSRMRRPLVVTATLAALLFITPLPTLAASKATFFGPIVPAECSCTNQKVEGTDMTITTAPDYGCVLQVLQNVINFAVSLSIILLTIYLVIAAFGLLTSGGKPDALTAAKTRILNVVIGLAVILTSWLIVDFVMKTLYNDAEFGPWNGILAAEGSADRCIVAREASGLTTGIIEILSGSSEGVGTTASGGVPGAKSGAVYSDAQARNVLKAGGVEIIIVDSSRALTNTRADTINQALEVKKACGCRVVVTSTTGGNHSTSGTFTHRAGYKIDLDDNAGLDRFLSGLAYAGIRNGDKAKLYKDRCGNVYAREATHWDIAVTNGVCKL